MEVEDEDVSIDYVEDSEEERRGSMSLLDNERRDQELDSDEDDHLSRNDVAGPSTCTATTSAHFLPARPLLPNSTPSSAIASSTAPSRPPPPSRRRMPWEEVEESHRRQSSTSSLSGGDAATSTSRSGSKRRFGAADSGSDVDLDVKGKGKGKEKEVAQEEGDDDQDEDDTDELPMDDDRLEVNEKEQEKRKGKKSGLGWKQMKMDYEYESARSLLIKSKGADSRSGSGSGSGSDNGKGKQKKKKPKILKEDSSVEILPGSAVQKGKEAKGKGKATARQSWKDNLDLALSTTDDDSSSSDASDDEPPPLSPASKLRSKVSQFKFDSKATRTLSSSSSTSSTSSLASLSVLLSNIDSKSKSKPPLKASIKSATVSVTATATPSTSHQAPISLPPSHYILPLPLCPLCHTPFAKSKSTPFKSLHISACAQTKEYTSYTTLVLIENYLLNWGKTLDEERREEEKGRTLFERVLRDQVTAGGVSAGIGAEYEGEYGFGGSGRKKAKGKAAVGSGGVTVVGVTKADDLHPDQACEEERLEQVKKELEGGSALGKSAEDKKKEKVRKVVKEIKEARRQREEAEKIGAAEVEEAEERAPRPTGNLKVDSTQMRRQVYDRKELLLAQSAPLPIAEDVSSAPSDVDAMQVDLTLEVEGDDEPFPATQPFEPSKLASESPNNVIVTSASPPLVQSTGASTKVKRAGAGGTRRSMWSAADGTDESSISRYPSSSKTFAPPRPLSPSPATPLNPSRPSHLSPPPHPTPHSDLRLLPPPAPTETPKKLKAVVMSAEDSPRTKLARQVGVLDLTSDPFEGEGGGEGEGEGEEEEGEIGADGEEERRRGRREEVIEIESDVDQQCSNEEAAGDEAGVLRWDGGSDAGADEIWNGADISGEFLDDGAGAEGGGNEWAEGEGEGVLVWDGADGAGGATSDSEDDLPLRSFTQRAAQDAAALSITKQSKFTTRQTNSLDDSDTSHSSRFSFSDGDDHDSDSVDRPLASTSKAKLPAKMTPATHPDLPDFSSYPLHILQKEVAKYGYRISKERTVLVEQLTEVWIYVNVTLAEKEAELKKTKGKSKAKDAIGKGRKEKLLESEVMEQMSAAIRKKEELWTRILRYEPVFFDEFLTVATEAGIKVAKPVIVNCLDELCITFYTQDPTNGSRKRYR